MDNLQRSRCQETMVWGSILVGASLGLGVGIALGGWVGGLLGAVAGGVIGFFAGAGASVLLCTGDDWRYAKPSFTSASLHARPNPALEDATCAITISYQVDGNTDLALCEITYEIEAEEATPPQAPPLPPVRNTSSSFGRHTYPFFTKWDDPHDGRQVTGKLTLVATKGGQTYAITETVAPIRVPVQPNP